MSVPFLYSNNVVYVNGNRPTVHGRGSEYPLYSLDVERKNIKSKYSKIAFFTIFYISLFTVILSLDVRNTDPRSINMKIPQLHLNYQYTNNSEMKHH